jgi:hypothetical protein
MASDPARQLHVPRGSSRPIPIVKPKPVKLKLRLLVPPLHRGKFLERPVKNAHCILTAAKTKLEADTDDNGVVLFEVPAQVTRATLQVGKLWSAQLLMAGHLAFLDDKGEVGRLANLALFTPSDFKRFLEDKDELERLASTGHFGKVDEPPRYRALKRFEAAGAAPLPPRNSVAAPSALAQKIDSRLSSILEEIHDR